MTSKSTWSSTSNLDDPNVDKVSRHPNTDVVNEVKQQSKFALMRRYFKAKLNLTNGDQHHDKPSVKCQQIDTNKTTMKTKSKFNNIFSKMLPRHRRHSQTKQITRTLESQASAHRSDDEDEDEGLAKTPDSLHDHSFIINSQVRKISRMDYTCSSTDSFGSFLDTSTSMHESTMDNNDCCLQQSKLLLIDSSMSKSKISAAKRSRRKPSSANAQSVNNENTTIGQSTLEPINASPTTTPSSSSIAKSTTDRLLTDKPHDLKLFADCTDPNSVLTVESTAWNPTSLIKNNNNRYSSYIQKTTPLASVPIEAPGAVIKDDLVLLNTIGKLKHKSTSMKLETTDGNARQQQEQQTLPVWCQIALKKQEKWQQVHENTSNAIEPVEHDLNV